jgi:hypothetical protein
MSDAFLQDCLEHKEFAKEVGVSERTQRRYEDVLGMPFIQLGRKRYIHVPTARQWLMSRMRRRNPERQPRPRSQRKHPSR